MKTFVVFAYISIWGSIQPKQLILEVCTIWQERDQTSSRALRPFKMNYYSGIKLQIIYLKYEAKKVHEVTNGPSLLKSAT